MENVRVVAKDATYVLRSLSTGLIAGPFMPSWVDLYTECNKHPRGNLLGYSSENVGMLTSYMNTLGHIHRYYSGK